MAGIRKGTPSEHVAPHIAGRKRKLVQQTFALYDAQVRVVQEMKAFRRVKMVFTDHLPAMQDGDLVVFSAPLLPHALVGEAEVIEHKHIPMGSGEYKTALAVHMLGEPKNDTEVEGG